MKIRGTFILTIAALIGIMAAGCNLNGTPVLAHKLVATAGQTSIPLYPDEHTLIEVSHRAQQGGCYWNGRERSKKLLRETDR